MSVISMKQLLEAGVHFGHQTRKWNPKMKQYIFTARNDIHILNLEVTQEQIDKAYNFVRDVVASGKNILFVGTKKQAQEAIKEEAERCGMFYINTRWLGGTLTNFKTIRNRVERLNKLNQMEKVGEFDLLPKKEVALLKQERDKLEKNLGGIKEMRELPGALFVVDPTNEKICVHEANILNIERDPRELVSDEAAYLGMPLSQYPDKRREYVVISIEPRRSILVGLYGLASGRTGEVKVSKLTFDLDKFKVGDVLMERNFHKRPLYTYENGVRTQVPGKTEIWLDEYEVVYRRDAELEGYDGG